MIHSLSGGVIADNGYYTFVKVVFEDERYADRPYWFVSPTSSVEVGNAVLASPSKQSPALRARVVKVEKNVSSQCSPIPMNRITEIQAII